MNRKQKMYLLEILTQDLVLYDYMDVRRNTQISKLELKELILEIEAIKLHNEQNIS